MLWKLNILVLKPSCWNLWRHVGEKYKILSFSKMMKLSFSLKIQNVFYCELHSEQCTPFTLYQNFLLCYLAFFMEHNSQLSRAVHWGCLSPKLKGVRVLAVFFFQIYLSAIDTQENGIEGNKILPLWMLIEVDFNCMLKDRLNRLPRTWEALIMPKMP